MPSSNLFNKFDSPIYIFQTKPGIQLNWLPWNSLVDSVSNKDKLPEGPKGKIRGTPPPFGGGFGFSFLISYMLSQRKP